MSGVIVLAAGAWAAAVVCFMRYAVPARPALRNLLAEPVPPRDEEGQRQGLDELEHRLGQVGSRVLTDLGVDVVSSRQADLAVVERSAEDHLGTKLAVAVVGALLVVMPRVMLWSAAPPSVSLVPVALIAAAIGFVVPDVHVRVVARRRREELAAVVGFAARVARIAVAGGEGVQPSLAAALRFGDGWAHHRLRRALAEVPGRSASQALDELGRALAVPEAERLASAVAIAQQKGAPLLGALGSIAETIRADRLRTNESAQARRTVWMSAPVGLMVAGYMAMFLVAIAAQVVAVFEL